jgi:myo-inositol-1(or 4)-monophosphatase
VSDLLATALSAADAAATMLADAIARWGDPIRSSRGVVRGKSSPRDLVTDYDVDSERLIREHLARAAPGIPIVGEEGGADPAAATSERRWLVDPIDGTVNFAHGLPLWSVSIALEDAAGPAVGVVVAPALGWRFWAARGEGAWTGPTGGAGFAVAGAPARLAVSAATDLAQAMLVTGFPYDRAIHPVNNFAEWEHFQRVAGACRRLGCASLDLCMVARGWIDGYWERRLSPWDIAAGALIVAEAGGRVTDTRGGPFRAHSGEVVASGGGIHDQLIAHLAQVAGAGQK